MGCAVWTEGAALVEPGDGSKKDSPTLGTWGWGVMRAETGGTGRNLSMLVGSVQLY